MATSHDPPPPGNSPTIPRPHLDWTNRVAVRTWLAALCTALADEYAVMEDLLRPPRERELGHVKHVELHGDAVQTLDELIAFATPPDDR